MTGNDTKGITNKEEIKQTINMITNNPIGVPIIKVISIRIYAQVFNRRSLIFRFFIVINHSQFNINTKLNKISRNLCYLFIIVHEIFILQ